MAVISVNGGPLELEEGNTVEDLVRQLKLDGRPVAVEVNRNVIPRKRHATQALHDGDTVEVVTLVGGG